MVFSRLSLGHQGYSLEWGGTLVSLAFWLRDEQFASPEHSVTMATLAQTPKPQGQSLEQDLQNGEPKQDFPLHALSRVFIIVTGS